MHLFWLCLLLSLTLSLPYYITIINIIITVTFILISVYELLMSFRKSHSVACEDDVDAEKEKSRWKSTVSSFPCTSLQTQNWSICCRRKNFRDEKSLLWNRSMMEIKDQSGPGTKREPGKEHNTFYGQGCLNSQQWSSKTQNKIDIKRWMFMKWAALPSWYLCH